MTLSPFLRSKIHRLCVTAVESHDDLVEHGAIVLGPRLCWAARLAEFEWVEVHVPNRCVRFPAYVLLGGEGSAQISSPRAQLVQPGDSLKVIAYAWLGAEAIAKHSATLVLAGRHNAPIEIRQVAGRSVPLDPSFLPLPPRQESFQKLHSINHHGPLPELPATAPP